jgi:membrane-bound lytic murein transglycosylase MltF
VSPSPTPPAPGASDEPLSPLPSESALPESIRALIDRPFTGDLDGMEARRMIRVGVPFNRTHFFIDRGTQRGLSVAFLREFERTFNAARKTGLFPVHVVIVPLARDLLLPALIDGRVDAVAAQKTITSERQALVDFSVPLRRNVSEIVVTGPDGPAVNAASDLSGREVFVRRSSSYYESLLALNRQLALAGQAPVTILEAPENLEDDDLLELVDAGLVDATVVDDFLARFWTQIFPRMRLHETATLRTGAELAVAFRKSSPRLAREANAFITRHRIGTTFGNVVDRRYLRSTQAVNRATSGADLERFLSMRELFRRYGEQYDLDYLLMMALGYRESRLNQAARSRLGAIGVMQLMPATGRALDVGDIRQVEPNIHAGNKYIRQLMDEVWSREPMDELNRGLFTLASYNAGSTRIRRFRREAEQRGLDPNVWFAHVERIAAERIGRETVSYVSTIYKYYIAYRLVSDEKQRRIDQKSRLRPPARPGSH